MQCIESSIIPTRDQPKVIASRSSLFSLRGSLFALRSSPFALRARSLGFTALLALSGMQCKPSAGSRLDPSHAGKPFGAISFRTIDGASLESGKGLAGKVVVIDAFATWCDPCLRLIPVLAGLDRKHRDRGLAVLGIALDRDPRILRTVLARHAAGYAAGLRAENEPLAARLAEISPEGAVPPIPATAILDRKGRLRAFYVGLGDGDAFLEEIRATVEALLDEP